MVRMLTAERRREASEDRPSATVGLAISGINRVTAMARRLFGIRSAEEACAGC
jgi:hypothetical protein